MLRVCPSPQDPPSGTSLRPSVGMARTFAVPTGLHLEVSPGQSPPLANQGLIAAFRFRMTPEPAFQFPTTATAKPVLAGCQRATFSVLAL
jgi:hypothetical protein